MRQLMPEPQRQERVVTALRQLSVEVGRSAAQVALAWLRNRDVPVIPIVGARKLPQLEDNLACLSLTLGPDQVERLNQASPVELGFPHDFLRREMVRAFLYAGMREQIIT
jgi:aryl-alcohol dehydrogenase-like predicted oxidoreductase